MYAVRENRIWMAGVSSAVLMSASAAVPAYGHIFLIFLRGLRRIVPSGVFGARRSREGNCCAGRTADCAGFFKKHAAVSSLAGNTTAAEALLRAGAAPYGKMVTGTYNSMLHEAARRGGKVVDVLLEAGVFPNVVIDGNVTPLHVAVQSGQVGAVALLL